MNILIVGYDGYVGPLVVEEIRATCLDANLYGLDTNFFNSTPTSVARPLNGFFDVIWSADLRTFDLKRCPKIDTVIFLAGISNDPIGNSYERVTNSINVDGTRRFIDESKALGVSRFIFSSSCSVYGDIGNKTVNESSDRRPLTAYARSKAVIEDYLDKVSDNHFQCIALRFGTACGSSTRMRLDLALNDFVFSGLMNKRIVLNSSGESYRPMIHVRDMARLIGWAVRKDAKLCNGVQCVNAGSDEFNVKIIDMARTVADSLQISEIVVPDGAPSDNRSYSVSFQLLREVALEYYPQYRLSTTINDLIVSINSLIERGLCSKEDYIRLTTLQRLRSKGLLDENFYWT